MPIAIIQAEQPKRTYVRRRVLRGADAIAEKMNVTRRRVYHLAHRGKLPVFKDGGVLCADEAKLEA